jgi:hypothetical protein
VLSPVVGRGSSPLVNQFHGNFGVVNEGETHLGRQKIVIPTAPSQDLTRRRSSGGVFACATDGAIAAADLLVRGGATLRLSCP